MVAPWPHAPALAILMPRIDHHLNISARIHPPNQFLAGVLERFNSLALRQHTSNDGGLFSDGKSRRAAGQFCSHENPFLWFQIRQVLLSASVNASDPSRTCQHQVRPRQCFAAAPDSFHFNFIARLAQARRVHEHTGRPRMFADSSMVSRVRPRNRRHNRPSCPSNWFSRLDLPAFAGQ